MDNKDRLKIYKEKLIKMKTYHKKYQIMKYHKMQLHVIIDDCKALTEDQKERIHKIVSEPSY